MEIVLSVQEDFLKHIVSFIYQIYAVFVANFNTGGVWIVFARLWWRWGLVCVGGGAILYLFLFLAMKTNFGTYECYIRLELLVRLRNRN